MAHEVAKLLLEHAGSFLERTEAVKSALGLGMPLREIEECLDWLDATRGRISRPESGVAKDAGRGFRRASPRVESAPAEDTPTAAEVLSPSRGGSG
jgi:hypothetical protein